MRSGAISLDEDDDGGDDRNKEKENGEKDENRNQASKFPHRRGEKHVGGRGREGIST